MSIQSNKIIRYILLILMVVLYIYLLSVDIFWLIELNYLNPFLIFIRILFLISIIGVALNKLFGPIIALIINIIALIGTIIVAIIYSLSPYYILFIAIRLTIIVLAILMMSTRKSASVPKYQASGYIEATEQQHSNILPISQQQVNQPNRFCPNCGASIQGNFCTSCGTKI